MTTSANEGFTVVSSSGNGPSWSDTSDLLDPTLGEATTGEAGSGTTDTLHFSCPAWAADVGVAGVLNTLTVTLEAYQAGPTKTESDAYLEVTGGNDIALPWSDSNTSYQYFTLSGDKDYWGWNSKSPRQALADIVDGTVKFQFRVYVDWYTVSFWGPKNDLGLRNVQIQVDYTPASAIGAPIIASL